MTREQFWDGLPTEAKDNMLAETGKKLPVKHVASPDEIAEAYLFLMKYVRGLDPMKHSL